LNAEVRGLSCDWLDGLDGRATDKRELHSELRTKGRLMSITLDASRETDAKPGTHGGFSESAVKFKLSHGKTAGFIIQHVTRSFEVFRLENGTPATAPMDADAINKYIGSVKAYPAITEYWEAFLFDNGDEEHVDNFQLTDFSSKTVSQYYLNGTKGNFGQKGEATFYASNNGAKTLEDLGFAKNWTITNGLLYSATAPDANHLPKTTSQAVNRETQVDWDDTQYKSTHYKTHIASDTP
jgi:hypothetical protein